MKTLPRAIALLLLSAMTLSPLTACKTVPPSVSPGSMTTPADKENKPENTCQHTPSVGGTYCTTCNEIIKTDLKNNYNDDLFFIPDTYDTSIVDNIVNLMKNRLPKKYNISSSDIQVLTPMRVGPIGYIALNKILQDKLNISPT